MLGDPGAVSRAGLKGATNVFKNGRKSPWQCPGYRLSPNHLQTVKKMLVPDWAQKLLCIIVPNRRTASPEFFSWVRTRRLLSRHSCPVRSPSFPNHKRRKYRWVEKRFRYYQQEQFNLHWENSVSDRSQCIVNNRKFKGLFTWRWGTPGRWGNPLRWRNPPVHMISHFNVITFTL